MWSSHAAKTRKIDCLEGANETSGENPQVDANTENIFINSKFLTVDQTNSNTEAHNNEFNPYFVTQTAYPGQEPWQQLPTTEQYITVKPVNSSSESDVDIECLDIAVTEHSKASDDNRHLLENAAKANDFKGSTPLLQGVVQFNNFDDIPSSYSKELEPSRDDDQAVDVEEEDDNLYCICNQMSYGKMIACDNDNCPYKWFHYDCVLLKKAPKGSWYCPDCKEAMTGRPSRKRKFKN